MQKQCLVWIVLLDWGDIVYGDKILFFDFDGTIADTAKYHKMAAREALNHYGFSFDVSSYFGKGKSNLQIMNQIKEDYHIDFPIYDIINLKNSLFLTFASELSPYVEIEHMIKSLPNRKFVITQNDKDIVETLLKNWNLKDYFQNIISLSESDVSKSALITKIGLAPENCVLFDDYFDFVIDAIDKGIEGILVENGALHTITNEEWLNHLAWDTKSYWLAGVCSRANIYAMANNKKLMQMTFWKDWLNSKYDGTARHLRLQ